jgi:hypothetical protein
MSSGQARSLETQLEAVVIPVIHVERAKGFSESVGWRAAGRRFRVR